MTPPSSPAVPPAISAATGVDVRSTRRRRSRDDADQPHLDTKSARRSRGHGSWLLGLALALIAVLLPPPIPAEAATDRPGAEPFATAILLSAHQQLRHDALGNGELTWSDELASLARRSSDRMVARNQLGHDPRIRDALSGRRGNNVGTIYSAGLQDPQAVRRAVGQLMQAWVASSGHRTTMLDRRMTHVGIGVTIDGDRVWATVVFQSRDMAVLGAHQPLEPRPLTTACPAGSASSSFVDVSGTHALAVGCLADRGIVIGVDADRFVPASSVTRAQLAIMLDRMLQASGDSLPPPLHGAFSDVRSNSTAGPAIERLAAAGIVTGHSDGSFRPDAPVTRAQLAVQLDATTIHLDGDTATTTRGHFRDVPSQARFARAIDASGHQGVMTGDTRGRFHGDATLRRDHAATVLARYLDLRLAG